MVSLNQIVTRIESIVNQYYFVKSFASGNISQISELDSADDMLYPRVYLNQLGASSQGGAFYYNFELIVVDLVKKDRSNEQEVKSDTLQTAIGIMNLLERPEYLSINADAFFSPTQTVSYSFLSEQYSDRVSGVIAPFQIKQGFEWNKCIEPVTANC